MPKVLSSSAKLRLEKTSSVGATATTRTPSSSPSPRPPHHHQHHQQQQQLQEQKTKSTTSDKSSTNGSGNGMKKMKKKRKKTPSSETTTPQRQKRQVTAESSSLLPPARLLPPLVKKEKDALEKNKKKSRTQNASTFAASAAAAAAPPPPPPSRHHVMEKKKDALEKKESRTKSASTSSVTVVAAAPPPAKSVMEQKKTHPGTAGATSIATTTTTTTTTVESSLSAVASSATAEKGGSTTATVATTTKKKTLKRKRSTNNAADINIASHPFRIKVKCVVALRMQPQGNHVVQIIIQQQQPQQQSEQQHQQQHVEVVTEVPIFPSLNFVHVWTKPLAGRDEGLALIGKRIRCFFPKNLLVQQQQQQPGNNNNNNSNTAKQKQRRVLEGEVVSVQASSCSSGNKVKINATTTTTTTTIHHFPPWKVELLVDKTMLDHFSFLIQTNIQQEQQQEEHNNANSTTNKTHLRNSRLEQIIRGENKVTVKMRLQNPNHHPDESASLSNCVKWVIQKRVPTKLFKSSSSSSLVVRRNNNVNNINNNTSNDAVVTTIQDDDATTKLTTTATTTTTIMTNGKLHGHNVGESNLPTNTATTTIAITDTTTTITDPSSSSSSSYSPLLARTLHGTGNNNNKTNGVVHNVPTAFTTIASSSTPPPAVRSPPPDGEQQQQQPVKKRRKLSSTDNNNNNNSNSNNAVVIKHVGDGNDSADQQVANWRWLASRYHDYMLQQQQYQQSPNTMNDNNGQQQPPSLSSSSSSLTSASAAAAATAESMSAGLVGEVVKVEATSSLSTISSSSLPLSSLAFVTIRRLVLPELTASGRLPYHGLHDIFNLDNDDNNNDDDGDDIGSKTEQKEGQQQQQQQQQQQAQFFRIPVEELIVISRTIQNEFTGTENQYQQQQLELCRTHGYSPSQDKYTALEQSKVQSVGETGNDKQVTRVCHLCRRLFRSAAVVKCGVECTNADCPVTRRQGNASCTFWCNSCVQSFRRPFVCNTTTTRGGGGDDSLSSSSCLPCCARFCDCRDCRRWIGSDLHQDLYQSALEASTEIGMNGTSSSSKNGSGRGFFSLAQSIVESVGTIDFGLPHDFLDLSSLPAPAAKPMTRIKTRKAKQWKKGGVASGKKRSSARSGDRDGEPKQQRRRREPEDYSVFKPTCVRLLPYAEMKRLRQEYEDSYEVPIMAAINTERPRNLRQTNKQDDDDEKDGNNNSKTMESRAARVKQRRLLKSVAGIQSFEVDTLAGRESQLRFGRSGIHAWGVYADADITAGDMIVEYRGELIENAMAEKREKEYETAKIGSDYMFRIDKDTVCDATKVGNVARFINASCDPNCYTKIITVGSEKRIVIYAKRDISAGQELCYDYKFPLEYNESKRIPCHCGSRNCRGFMNWDKRYVSVSSPEDERKPAATESEQHNSNNKE